MFNPKMDMQKIVTLDGFGVPADPRDHIGQKRNFKQTSGGRLFVKVLQ